MLQCAVAYMSLNDSEILQQCARLVGLVFSALPWKVHCSFGTTYSCCIDVTTFKDATAAAAAHEMIYIPLQCDVFYRSNLYGLVVCYSDDSYHRPSDMRWRPPARSSNQHTLPPPPSHLASHHRLRAVIHWVCVHQRSTDVPQTGCIYTAASARSILE